MTTSMRPSIASLGARTGTPFGLWVTELSQKTSRPRRSHARTCVHWARVRFYEHLDAWVLRIVTNLAIDALAKPHHRELRSTGVSAEDAVVLRVTLAQALRALPARQRDAVVLRYLVDMSEADAAAALGIAPGTLKSHLHRAVERLRMVLGSAFDPRFEEG
jgi:DNA-directed RNA polymerase specialized sigma subunit